MLCYTHIAKYLTDIGDQIMTFCEELYFEITLTGRKSELKKFVSFLKSGELDEFFEFDSDYINYDDEYATADPEQETSVILSNDDFGIEIDEFDSEEFLEVFCKAGTALEIKGRFFDIDDEEFEFISAAGDSYYVNAKKSKRFNDELDAQAYEEDQYED